MKPVDIAGATRNLAKPKYWDSAMHGSCGDLTIRDEERSYGNAMVSEWVPSPEELQELCLGGTVLLAVAGKVHPPVAIAVQAKPKTSTHNAGSDIGDD